MRALVLLLLLLSSNAYASRYPELCEDAGYYDESSYFVTIPATVGGCIGNIIGLPIGFIIGIPLGHPTEAAAITGAIVNSGFHAVVGFPFYLLEYVPRAIFGTSEESNEDSEEDMDSEQATQD